MKPQTICFKPTRLGISKRLAITKRSYAGILYTTWHSHISIGKQDSYLMVTGKESADTLTHFSNQLCATSGINLERTTSEEVEQSMSDIPLSELYWVGITGEYPNPLEMQQQIVTSENDEQIYQIDPIMQAADEIEYEYPHPPPGTATLISFWTDENNWQVALAAAGTSKTGARKAAETAAETAGIQNITIIPNLTRRILRASAAVPPPVLTGVFLNPLIAIGVGMLSAGLAYASGRNDMSFALPNRIPRVIKKTWDGRVPRKNSISFPTSDQPQLFLCSTKDRSVMPDLSGVVVMMTARGSCLRIPDEERYRGSCFIGSSGSGKSTGMMWMAAGDAVRGAATSSHTTIWVETKRDGKDRLYAMLESQGITPIVVSISSPTGPQIRFNDWTDTHQDALALTDAIANAFPYGSFMEKSRDVLASLLELAALVYPAHLYRAKCVPINPTHNLMKTCWLLAGGGGWDHAKRIIAELKHTTANQEKLDNALHKYNVHFETSSRDKNFEAVRNKLNRLMEIPIWDLNLSRTIYTWEDLLKSSRPIIIDLSLQGGDTNKDILRVMVPLVFHSFWVAAQKTCHGWNKLGKTVSLYCDEASHLDSESAEVLTEIADQGRSHGLSLALGAQSWENLSDTAQHAISHCGHKFFFRMNDQPSAQQIAHLLGEDVVAKQILDLTQYHALATVTLDNNRYGPSTGRVLPEKFWNPSQHSWIPSNLPEDIDLVIEEDTEPNEYYDEPQLVSAAG